MNATASGCRSRIVAGIAACLLLAGPTARAATPEVEIVIDCSGSMTEKIAGKSRMEIAKESLAALLDKIPAKTHLGLRAYGHRVGSAKQDKLKGCVDAELLVPIGPADRAAMKARIGGIAAHGWTPIAYSLEQAANDFVEGPDGDRSIILLSDGKETCDGDPAAVAKKLREGGLKVMTHVVGLAVDAPTRAELERIAEAGGGKYFDAQDHAQLASGLEKAAELSVLAQPTPTPAPEEKPAFVDEFDGSALGDAWERPHPDEDHFLVENGSVLILTRGPGADKEAHTTFHYNALRLKRGLPADFEVVLDVELEASQAQTVRLDLVQDDKTNVVLEMVWDTNYPEQSYLHLTKVTGGEANTLKDTNGRVAKSLLGFQAGRNTMQFGLRKVGRAIEGFVRRGEKEVRLEQKILKLEPHLEIGIGLTRGGNYPEREVKLLRFTLKELASAAPAAPPAEAGQ